MFVNMNATAEVRALFEAARAEVMEQKSDELLAVMKDVDESSTILVLASALGGMLRNRGDGDARVAALVAYALVLQVLQQ